MHQYAAAFSASTRTCIHNLVMHLHVPAFEGCRIEMHIWRGLLQQSQAGEDEREEEDEEGGKDAIGAPAKADLLLLGSRLLRLSTIHFTDGNQSFKH